MPDGWTTLLNPKSSLRLATHLANNCDPSEWPDLEVVPIQVLSDMCDLLIKPRQTARKKTARKKKHKDFRCGDFEKLLQEYKNNGFEESLRIYRLAKS